MPKIELYGSRAVLRAVYMMAIIIVRKKIMKGNPKLSLYCENYVITLFHSLSATMLFSMIFNSAKKIYENVSYLIISIGNREGSCL
jgi:hypothetical protein